MPAEIVATAPVAQIQNCQTRCRLEQSETALRQNLSQKGDNAYYFAHGRHFEIPEDAKIISGPGLVTGGPPELLEKSETLLNENDKVNLIKEYSWADAGAKVKIYISCEAFGETIRDDQVKADFAERSFVLDIASQPLRKLKLDKLKSEIKPEDCKVRVETSKNRITVVLAKKRETFWSDLLSSK